MQASKSWPGAIMPMRERSDAAPINDDAALAERARANISEFALLYDRYVGAIYAYCYLRLGTRELAEDATSETFERAMAAMPRYKATYFRAWLYRIAHNVVVDHFRRKRPEPLDQKWQLFDAQSSPESAVLRADSDQHVRSLLRKLTPDQREVLELELAGLSGPEIAEALNRRQGAIRAVRFRAYARLRELLAEGAES